MRLGRLLSRQYSLIPAEQARQLQERDRESNALFAKIEQLLPLVGEGSPEGIVTAQIGAIYRRLDGSTGTSFYVKESGTGNTGWVAK